jgi:hypothetical protein
MDKPMETPIINEYLQKRLYRTESSRLIVSQPSPLLKGLLAFQMASRYLISNIEKTTNLKNAAVAKALNKDSAWQQVTTIIYQIILIYENNQPLKSHLL